VDVFLLEMSASPGDANVGGGVLYGAYAKGFGLIDLVPDFEARAPLERRVYSHEVYALSKPDDKNGSFRAVKLDRNSLLSRLGLFNVELETGHDYTVFRSRFDSWLAREAVAAGATLSLRKRATGLLRDKGAVVGVKAGGEELRAKLVVDCSGVNSNLGVEAGIREHYTPRKLFHGLKRVYGSDTETVDSRLKLRPGEGKALSFVGDFMLGLEGGGFVYAGKDTIAVGVVATADSLIRATTERFEEVGSLNDALLEFEAHPMIADSIEGMAPLESSVHDAPRGHKGIPKKPYADGILLAGDALGSFVKIGPMVDGIRPAIATGMMAARTYLEASASGSFGSKNLSRYREFLKPVYDDVSRSGRDSFMSESGFIRQTIPGLLFRARMARSREGEATTEGASAKMEARQVVSQREEMKRTGDLALRVETAVASASSTKPWVPVCPTGCFKLVTPDGDFSSFKELYLHNIARAGGLGSNETPTEGQRKRAVTTTITQMREGKLAFDGTGCVECGMCVAIGPPETVAFTGLGIGPRYLYG
jgi:electron transfer flavoprotein-quinone oxidoreductase